MDRHTIEAIRENLIADLLAAYKFLPEDQQFNSYLMSRKARKEADEIMERLFYGIEETPE